MYDLYNKLLFIYVSICIIFSIIEKHQGRGNETHAYTYTPQTQTTLDVLAFWCMTHVWMKKVKSTKESPAVDQYFHIKQNCDNMSLLLPPTMRENNVKANSYCVVLSATLLRVQVTITVIIIIVIFVKLWIIIKKLGLHKQLLLFLCMFRHYCSKVENDCLNIFKEVACVYQCCIFLNQ